jgi:hypothetical protein
MDTARPPAASAAAHPPFAEYTHEVPLFREEAIDPDAEDVVLLQEGDAVDV